VYNNFSRQECRIVFFTDFILDLASVNQNLVFYRNYFMWWPFKKSPEPENIPAATVNTIICIPGFWHDFEQIKNTVLSSGKGNYLVVDDIFLDVKQERQYKFEIRGHDGRMKKLFEYEGNSTGIKNKVLDEIEQHSHVIYITGETGSLAEAEYIAFAGAAILEAGGLAIRVETAGKAFDKKTWLNIIKKFQEADLYQLFVTDATSNKNDAVWSCGMHNLGLKDTIVSGEEYQTAVDLITIFGYYQIIDKPVITTGEIFQPDSQSPQYKISIEPNQPYKDIDLFENPYGMWRLTRI
jgi:hypothetical protein